MQDSDIRRLEERIEATQRETQLRFERMFERVDGAVARITDQVTTIHSELQTQRAEMLSVRRDAQDEIGRAVSGFRDTVADYRTEVGASRIEAREHYRWIIGTILATVIPSALVIAGLIVSILFGGFQVWGIGVQVGQSAPIHAGTTRSAPTSMPPTVPPRSSSVPAPPIAPAGTPR